MTPGKGRTILLVEDEAQVRKLIFRILRLHEYNVLEAEQGQEALAVSAAYRGTIHLLVTDIMMPVMSGHELAVRLSKLRPEAGILFISGYAGGITPDGLASAHDKVGFIAKPFKALELLDKVAHLIRTIHGPGPEEPDPQGSDLIPFPERPPRPPAPPG
jgi:two-component system, cell cycle sensor histidine kinase and response regulator CckA